MALIWRDWLSFFKAQGEKMSEFQEKLKELQERLAKARGYL